MNTKRKQNANCTKYEFGMSDISVTMGIAFNAAVNQHLLFLKNKRFQYFSEVRFGMIFQN